MAKRPKRWPRLGERFGCLKLVRIIRQSHLDRYGRSYESWRFKCVCDCGNEVVVNKASGLVNGVRTHCTKGCSKRKVIDTATRSKIGSQVAWRRKLNGTDQNRIAAVKKAFKEGKYKARDKVSSKRMRATNLRNWKDPKYVANFLANTRRPINKFEKRVIRFMEERDLPFKFTGDGSYWVHPCPSGKRRNPDFVHIDRRVKKIVLAHGTYWHKDRKIVLEELRDYRSKGWECFIIWEDEALDDAMEKWIRKFLHGRLGTKKMWGLL